MEKTRQLNVIAADLRCAYYDDFHCLMGNCRQNCCQASWHITFDRKDYLKLKKQKGSPELNARLEHGLRRCRGEDAEKYAEFVTGGTVCPLFGADGLCTLQKEKGAGALPQVCRVFPRTETVRYSGFLERSLTPACEGVLSLLWDLPEGVEFRSNPLSKEEQVMVVFPEENPMTGMFQSVRSLCIDFLQDRRRPLPVRILLIGLALQGLTQGEADLAHFMSRGRYILEEGNAGELLRVLDDPRTLDLALHSNTQTLLSLRTEGDIQTVLEIMEQWLSVESQSGQTRINRAAYLTARARYEERFGDRAYFMENLMVSLFFHLAVPDMKSPEKLWKSYLDFCNLYAVCRFAAVMSCREGAAGDRDELFRLLVLVLRTVLHSQVRRDKLRERLFQNDSATLAHMAILLCGT